MPEISAQVTVLMSTYNGTQFLATAVESILAQTFSDWYLLVVDDASTDGSRELIRSYSDRRIRLVELSSNVGQTAALNHGLKMIQTPWIARLDQDDFALPERLGQQLTYVSRHSSTVLLGCWARFIDEFGHAEGAFKPPSAAAEVRKALYTRSCPVVHSAAFFRTKVAQNFGGYRADLDYTEDLELWLKMAEVGSIANIPEVLIHLRRHSGQTTHSGEVIQKLLAETLEVTSTLPPDMERVRSIKRAWRDYRVALMLRSAAYAIKSKCWSLARRYSSRALSGLLRDPLVIVRLVSRFFRRGVTL